MSFELSCDTVEKNFLQKYVNNFMETATRKKMFRTITTDKSVETVNGILYKGRDEILKRIDSLPYDKVITLTIDQHDCQSDSDGSLRVMFEG